MSTKLFLLNSVAPPEYNPYSQAGLIGHPFFLDFHYSGPQPSSFSWYKNGLKFLQVPGRISFDHRGITFLQLKQQDSGEYRISTRSGADHVTAAAHLRGGWIPLSPLPSISPPFLPPTFLPSLLPSSLYALSHSRTAESDPECTVDKIIYIEY